jgi:cell division protein FtsL
MVRLLNFFFVALAGLACLALYRVSEQTRVAHAQLHKIERQIVVEKNALHVLEADWQSVASPARIQRLAQAKLGIADTTTVQLSAYEELPRRGEDAPLGNTQIQQASMKVPAQRAPQADADDSSDVDSDTAGQ